MRIKNIRNILRKKTIKYEIWYNNLIYSRNNYNSQRISNNFDNKLHFALIKQDVCPNLYCCSTKTTIKKMLESSLKHSGPIGLFTKFNTDFFIIKTESNKECDIWKEVVLDCHHKAIDYYESLKRKPYLNGKHGHLYSQGKYSVFAKEVDWSQYDVVISVNIAVPSSITKKYPSTVWCYYISEPCMRSYEYSKKKIIEGYDLFLNQRFRGFQLSKEKLYWHEIDFPYNLQYFGCFHEILNQNIESDGRTGIFIESHTARCLSRNQLDQLEKYGELRFVSSKTGEIIRSLLKSKYFIRLGGRMMWGNSMIEAVASGCLALGNPIEFLNRSLFTNTISVKNIKDLLSKISRIENDNSFYRYNLKKQRNNLDYFCFYRPISELIYKAKEILKRRNI